MLNEKYNFKKITEFNVKRVRHLLFSIRLKLNNNVELLIFRISKIVFKNFISQQMIPREIEMFFFFKKYFVKSAENMYLTIYFIV